MVRERRGAGGSATAVSVDRYFDLSVLGLVTSGYFAVLGSGYLDIPTAAVTALGLFLRALMTIGIVRLNISGRLTMAATIVYIGFYPLDYLFVSQDFVTATVHLVFFLAVVKVLTAHATRDYVFLGIVGFLELLAASILSANLTFFVFLALFLSFGVATFASSEVRRSIRKPHQLSRGGLRTFQWRLAALTISMSAGILILTAGLFFLLPRTAQAAFRHLVPQRYHLPGFSNEMMLGEIGEIQKRQTPVMHVRFYEDRRQPGLKWRGMALGRFDGRRWYNPPDRGTPLLVGRDGMLDLVDVIQHRRPGDRISYEVQLGAMTSDALFLTGVPEMIRINSRVLVRTSGDSLRVGFPSSDGLRYGAYSDLAGHSAAGAYLSNPLTEEAKIGYLQLPEIDGRIPMLARRLTAGSGSDDVRAQAIQESLQTSFRYTTKLLDHEVPDPLAHFLFDRRAGHCEYFASAMAVMLRTLGIPSRVATGFQSGVYNPLSGWYVIRASDAHSWVEAYLPGRGWKTFDPTPPAQDVPSNSLFARLGFYMDAAETFWQEWVLNYNLDRQLTLASSVEDSGRSFSARWLDRLRLTEMRWRHEAVLFARRFGAAAVFLALLAGLGWWVGPRAWTWWRTLERVRQVKRGQARASDATLLYERMLRVMHRRGFERPVWITPAEFVRVLPSSETAMLVEQFTAEYNELRFGGNAEAATRMVGLLERIEHAPGG